MARLVAAGGVAGLPHDAEAARILAGFPRLGAEIGDKTLPQEVRYDEIGGVSYTKGCYVGQETVARVHFRGHANRMLRGVSWEGEAPTEMVVTADAREVGRITSSLQSEKGGFGLAVLRREVEPGSEVLVAGRPARVNPLPFAR
jgi:aminomethyltransferase